MKTKTPYQHQLQIKREIDALWTRYHDLENAAKAERIRVGLRRLGRLDTVFQVKTLNSLCTNGVLVCPTGHYLGKSFGIDRNHDSLGADVADGIHVTITVDDGVCNVHVSWKVDSPKEAKENLTKNVLKARKFFKRYGIKVDCGEVIRIAQVKATELLEAAKFIQAFKRDSYLEAQARQALQTALSLSQ